MKTDFDKANGKAKKNTAHGDSPASRFTFTHDQDAHAQDHAQLDSRMQGENTAEAAFSGQLDSRMQGENTAEAAFSAQLNSRMQGENTAEAAFSAHAAYAACATPPGISGIAVVRMSGEGSFEIADAVFASRSKDPMKVAEMKGYTCAFGDISYPDTGEVIDSVILTKFIAPHSYTGEDTVEISCHGGSAVKKNILEALFTAGARPALPGEFSRNAFLNGKMDLAQAEAVMDLISATAKKAGSEALHQMSGTLSQEIRDISRRLYATMSEIEMIVEFPEHEQTDEAIGDIDSQIRDIDLHLDSLISSFKKGRILKEGLTVVIAGKPNAGKSSMLNTLAGYDRAIVTPTPGTTRDTIEEYVDIEGLPVKLIDTAGLRNPEDEIEKSGIGRAKEAIEKADLVFWIFGEDGDDIDLAAEESELKEVLSYRRGNTLVFIIGKSDITPYEKNRMKLCRKFPDAQILPFSSVTKEGVEAVRAMIQAKYDEYGAGSCDEVIITNSRHRHAILKAKEAVELAKKSMTMHMPVDLLSSVLRNAADSLALITGDEVTQELVDEIFSRFCIGK